MAYIEKTKSPDDACVFCTRPAEGELEDEKNLILVRSKHAFVIANKFPYNTGHVMVVPFAHVDRYESLDSDGHADMSLLVARTLRALQQVYNPDGYNLGMNIGRAGGAGIPGHIHQHIVPRWSGDSNFMTTVGEAKVHPEALDETFRKLKAKLS